MSLHIMIISKMLSVIITNNTLLWVTVINFILPSNSKIECKFEFTKYSRGTEYLFTIY